jgi:hypothetical protein
MEQLAVQLAHTGRELTLNDCENVVWIYTQVSNSFKKTALQMSTKSKYYKRVPHLVSEADDPIMALECGNQLRSIDDANLTPLLRRQRDELLPAFDAPRQK